jgi:hypothetical protein
VCCDAVHVLQRSAACCNKAFMLQRTAHVANAVQHVSTLVHHSATVHHCNMLQQCNSVTDSRLATRSSPAVLSSTAHTARVLCTTVWIYRRFLLSRWMQIPAAHVGSESKWAQRCAACNAARHRDVAHISVCGADRSTCVAGHAHEPHSRHMPGVPNSRPLGSTHRREGGLDTTVPCLHSVRSRCACLCV